ncbi:Rpn family recombination-promoting nuclease/putative transposase [Frisingicoccus sp.]|uniref:Rpn family recombination-promoting nuclease/putative transposase n=1 Tax=Frisingicoccus sp. TaxID=1918627 RepID=UPI003AB2CB6D
MKNNNNQKPVRKPLKKLTLLDRFLFDTAMSDPEICRNILSIIFGDKEVPPIRIGIAEKTEEPYYDSRAVRMDLLAVDENEVIYDAEAQKENKGKQFLLRRSRLYQSAIDVNLLEPGELDFGKMNDVYVIFIAPFDLFGKNKYRYTFRMTCDEVPGLSMDDGAVRIFLNTHGKNDDEVPPGLVEFLHYVENPEQQEKEIQDERVRKLAGQIDMLKNSQEVGVKYMRLWEELEEARREGHDDGVAEGLTKGHALGLTEGQKVGAEAERVESIRKLMETMEWTAEQAMNALQIPMEDREKYKAMIIMARINSL